ASRRLYLCDRRRRVLRAAHGRARSRDDDSDLRSFGDAGGARGNPVLVLHGIRLRAGRRRPRARRDRGRRHRRHVAHGRLRQHRRNVARRAAHGLDPDVHLLQWAAQQLVDEDRHRRARACVRRPAEAARPSGRSPAKRMNAELTQVLEVGNVLGEGVLWDAAGQAVWWTDIHAARLYRYRWGARQPDCLELPERLCAFALTDATDVIIAAFASGFARYDVARGEREWLARPEAAYVGTRFNDGRVDRQGRFWCGTMVE